MSSRGNGVYDGTMRDWYNEVDVKDGRSYVNTGQSFDALGATEVSQLTTQIDLKQSGGQLIEFIDTVEIGTGVESFDSVTGSTSLSVTTNGDRVIAQTFQRTNYQTGKPKQVKQTLFNFNSETNVGKRFGYFSAEYGAPYTNNLDGFFFQQEADGSGVTLNVFRDGTEIISRPQSEWNGDYDFDSIDWESNILAIPRFVWLGVDQVQFAIKIGESKVVLHTEYFTNMDLQGVYMRYANQPLRWEIWSEGGSGSMNYICATAEKQGSLNQLGKIKGVDRGSTHQNANKTSSTYANIGIALDETSGAKFRNTVVDIVSGTSVALTNDAYVWRLYKNPTIAGTALSWNTVTDSGVKFFIGEDNNTITGGVLIQSGYVSQRQSTQLSIDNSIKLGVDLDGNPDLFVIGIQPIGANLDILCSINWRELD